MPSKATTLLAQEMNGVAAAVQQIIKQAVEPGSFSVAEGKYLKLSPDAAVLAALTGCLSVIRVDGMNEEELLREAKRAVPRDRMQGPM